MAADVGRDVLAMGTGGGAGSGGGAGGGAGGGTGGSTTGDASSDAGDATPVVDTSLMPIDGGVGSLPLSALQVTGSHNSFHTAPLIAFHPSHKYSHKPLDQQLEGGLRALELDVHLRGDGTFDIYHIAAIDPGATCSTFEDCLRVIATWSSAHPKHVPIFIWIEIKDETGGNKIDDLATLEPVILRVFPRERLITPASLRGTYASPRQRVSMAGWPTLNESRGKIMFSLVDRDDRTKAYSHDHTSLDDRLMFLNATGDEFDMPWAVVAELAPDDAGTLTRAHAARVMTVSNICSIDMADDACQQKLANALKNGIHMMKDDLPFAVSGRDYVLKLPAGSPGCNAVTAPPACRGPFE